MKPAPCLNPPVFPLAEWQVEEGIGEHRAIRLEHGHIVEARMDWPGQLAAGLIADARLIARQAGSPRGTARFPNGEEALVDGLPSSAREGAPIRLLVTRASLAERGRAKRAHARPTQDSPRAAPTLMQRLKKEGHSPRLVRRFTDGDWDEVAGEAQACEVMFSGGSLLLCPTPAMLLIDIDGAADSLHLALAAVPAVAESIRRLDISGPIGIDFPTQSTKQNRRAVDVALDNALAGWPHDRTAINGFGFVQIVTKRERASLVERATWCGAEFALRQLLRRAEALEGPGAVLLLNGPAALEARFTQVMRDELARRTGKIIRWQSETSHLPHHGFAQSSEQSGAPALALNATHAQLVPL